MELEFEWDAAKNEKTLARRGFDFKFAVPIFNGPVWETRSDREGEQRWTAIGAISGVEYTVIYTMRGTRHRIISARRARRNERRTYRSVYPLEPAGGEG